MSSSEFASKLVPWGYWLGIVFALGPKLFHLWLFRQSQVRSVSTILWSWYWDYKDTVIQMGGMLCYHSVVYALLPTSDKACFCKSMVNKWEVYRVTFQEHRSSTGQSWGAPPEWEKSLRSPRTKPGPQRRGSFFSGKCHRKTSERSFHSSGLVVPLQRCTSISLRCDSPEKIPHKDQVEVTVSPSLCCNRGITFSACQWMCRTLVEGAKPGGKGDSPKLSEPTWLTTATASRPREGALPQRNTHPNKNNLRTNKLLKLLFLPVSCLSCKTKQDTFLMGSVATPLSYFLARTRTTNRT